MAEVRLSRCDYGQAFTLRESQVFDLIMDGMTTKECALALRLSPKTVETHLFHCRRKLGARTRAHAIALYLRALHKAQATAGVAY